jgi:hypothetical protein
MTQNTTLDRRATAARPETVQVARAEALFASALPAGGDPTRTEVTAAIRDAVRAHGGTHGCAAAMAAAYGDSPETAAARMRWALRVVHARFAGRRGAPCSAAVALHGIRHVETEGTGR